MNEFVIKNGLIVNGGISTISGSLIAPSITGSLQGTASFAAISPITIGTTPISSGVAGRVLFEGAGNVMQEDSAFFWDNTNKRLGIGATPATTVRLDVRAQGALSTDIAFRVRNSADTLDIFSVNGNGILYKPHASSNNDNENDIFVSQMSDGRNKIRLFTKGSYNLSAGIGISFQSDSGGTVKSSYTLNGAFIVANGNYQDIVGRSVFNVGGSDITQISYFRLKDYSNTNTNIFIPRSGTIVLNPDNVYSQVRGLALFGGTLGTTADRVVSIGSGTAPTTSTADNFQLWSADIVAGNAAPHFRTENGSIVKLYQNAAVTTPQGIADALTNLGMLATSTITSGGGSSTITVGTTAISSGVVGRVLFEGTGNVAQEDSAFFWDNTNKRLGVGATTPMYPLDVKNTNGAYALNLQANADDVRPGIRIEALRPTNSGIAFNFFDLNIGQSPTITNVGVFGLYGEVVTSPSPSYAKYIYIGANSTTAYNNAVLKIDADNKIGIGLSGVDRPTATLDIKAPGALSTDRGIRVRNSADTTNLFEVRGDGNIALFQPGLYSANMKIFGPGGLTIAQFQNEVFGSIALGSEATFDALTYANVALGQRASTSGGSNSIAIGLNARAGNTANISIGANSVCIGQYGIKIGRHTGASAFGGINSIHLGRTTSGNNIEPDNVFMTYFDSQSSSTLTRSNGSFGLLGQQAYILGNGTGTYGLDTFMGNGGNTLVIANHTSIPSTNITNSFQQYSADIVAGNAAPHFRTENGSVIKLYKQDLPTNPTNAEIATFLSNLGLANLI